MGKILLVQGADFSENSFDVVNPQINQVDISVLASPSIGGVTSGSGAFSKNTNIGISATANNGFTFVKWNDGNHSATRTVNTGVFGKSFIALFAENVPSFKVAYRNKYLDANTAIGASIDDSIDDIDNYSLFRAELFEGFTYSVLGKIAKMSYSTAVIFLADVNNKLVAVLQRGSGYDAGYDDISLMIDTSQYPSAKYLYVQNYKDDIDKVVATLQ